MVRQYPLMQHIRIGNHHMPRLADRRARGGRRIPVVGIGLHRRIHFLDQRIQLRSLVAGQRLRGKQIQRAGGFILQYRIQHGDIVAQRLARSRGRDNHQVASGHGGFDRLRLMDVGTVDAALPQRVHDARRKRRGKFPIARGARRRHAPAGHIFHEARVVFQLLDVLRYGHRLAFPHAAGSD